MLLFHNMNKESETLITNRLEDEEIQAIIEALLFVSSEPIQEEEILPVIGMEHKDTLHSALSHLLHQYSQKGRGICIEKVAGGYRLATKHHLGHWIGKYRDTRNTKRLSHAAIETLSIIAYKQPITLPEIQLIRGVNPSGAIKTLLEKKMIRIAGRKKTIGKPFLYGTTKSFLIHFGLDRVEDLPSIEQFDRMIEASMDMSNSSSTDSE